MIDPKDDEAGPGRTWDVVLVGGGLANSLIALFLKADRPDLRVVMLERRPAADNDHTWCLFQSDVPGLWPRIAPLLDHVWDGYDVRFPAHQRGLPTPYGCLTSRGLGERVAAALGPDLRLGVDVSAVSPTEARCASGELYRAPLVIDGRGMGAADTLRLAYQKFVGLELVLRSPHGLARPVVMDATVPQLDGFRFVYTLPLGADRLLVEDTRYSNGADLDVEALSTAALAYAEDQGWAVRDLVRREHGVLPVVLGGRIGPVWESAWSAAGGPLPLSGVRGGFFHPTTGYSFGQAVRVAAAMAAAPRLTSEAIGPALKTAALQMWARGGFYRLINRMMFLAAEPDLRYRVLERFYRLPQPLVERFYAGRITPGDKLRILCGRPPVPVGRALAALPAHALEKSFA